MMRVDLPDPATPVTQVRTPVGMVVVMSCRLCRLAGERVSRPVGRRGSVLSAVRRARAWPVRVPEAGSPAGLPV
ncbi:hypothetical protein GCM10020220_023080 [Nonomuraea rubra]